MHLVPSRRTLLVAGVLIVLHALMWWRVVSYNVQYDAGDITWWLVAFWILPIAAAILLIVSVLRRVTAHARKDEE